MLGQVCPSLVPLLYNIIKTKWFWSVIIKAKWCSWSVFIKTKWFGSVVIPAKWWSIVIKTKWFVGVPTKSK